MLTSLNLNTNKGDQMHSETITTYCFISNSMSWIFCRSSVHSVFNFVNSANQNHQMNTSKKSMKIKLKATIFSVTNDSTNYQWFQNQRNEMKEELQQTSLNSSAADFFFFTKQVNLHANLKIWISLTMISSGFSFHFLLHLADILNICWARISTVGMQNAAPLLI